MRQRDSVSTPEYIVKAIRDEFGEFTDPCPYNPKFDAKVDKDGLTTEWGDVSFVNPPYSSVKPWFKKSREQWLLNKTVILFVKLRNLGTQYARKYIPGAEVRIMVNKVKFPGYENTALFNNILVIFRAGQHSTKYSIV
jgi:hypothetical protein